MSAARLAMLLAVVSSGCSACPDPVKALFRPGTEVYCRGPCPSLAAREAELLTQATAQWADNGTCSPSHVIRACQGGSTVLFTPTLCHDEAYFDPSGQMVGAWQECERVERRFGRSHTCDESSRRDPCSMTFSKFNVTGLTLDLSTPGPVLLDGVSVGATAKIAVGRHTLAVASSEYQLTFSPGESPEVVQISLRQGDADVEALFSRQRSNPQRGPNYRCELSEPCALEWQQAGWSRAARITVRPTLTPR